jgi:hypothetical protein
MKKSYLDVQKVEASFYIADVWLCSGLNLDYVLELSQFGYRHSLTNFTEDFVAPSG